MSEAFDETVALDNDRLKFDDVPDTVLGPPPPVLTAQPEQFVGPYRLIRQIGKGGMGAVWEALDTRLNRQVAVKLLLSEGNASPDDVERFRREATHTARLRHPNIVPVHDVGIENARSYLVMDFVHGITLSQALRQQQMTYREKALILVKVAGAVQYAHEQGVIHRDLKPANVMLETRAAGGSETLWNPLVMDFGLAKDIDADSSLSRSGQALGTPAYMPPEQAAGKSREMGPRSDVYSLGAILYEMITGRVPFTGENVLQILRALSNEDPALPRRIDPGVPKDLETICLKCLEKSPDKRYASAAAIVSDLRAWLDGDPISATRATIMELAAKRVKKNPGAYAVALAASLVIIATVAFGLYSINLQRAKAIDALNKYKAEQDSRDALDVARNLLLNRKFESARDAYEEIIARSTDPQRTAAAKLGLESAENAIKASEPQRQ